MAVNLQKLEELREGNVEKRWEKFEESIDEELYIEAKKKSKSETKKRDLEEIRQRIAQEYEEADFTWADYIDWLSVKLWQGVMAAYVFIYPFCLLGFDIAKHWASRIQANLHWCYALVLERSPLLCT
eukprot:1188312-Prorocentrum_minimum.AAC.4